MVISNASQFHHSLCAYNKVQDNKTVVAVIQYVRRRFISRPTFGAHVSPVSGKLLHITAHKLTPVKRDVATVVSDQWSRFTAPSIGDYYINRYCGENTAAESRLGHEM